MRIPAQVVLVALLALAPSPLRGAGDGGSVSAELRGDELELGLRMGLPSIAEFGLGMDAEADLARLRAFLRLGSGDDGRAALSVGPSVPDGCLRFVLSPLSATRVVASAPVMIDRSMQSSRSAICLGLKELYAFAIARGKEGLFSLNIEGPAAAAEESASSPIDEAAVGLAVAHKSAISSWAALVDLSSRPPDQGSEGWKPSRPSDIGGTIAHAAVFAGRDSPSSSARAAFAVSAGALEGRSFAASVQADGRLGAVSLNVSLGAADAGYRGLFGDVTDDLLFLKFGSRLALRRASSLAFFREVGAKRSGALAAPDWRSNTGAAFTASLGEGRSLTLSGELDGDVNGKVAFGLRKSVSLPAFSVAKPGLARSSFEFSYRWNRDEARLVEDSLELGVSLDRSFGSHLPGLDLRSALRFGVLGEQGYPTARGRLRITWPNGKGRELSVTLSLPDKGLPLGPIMGSGKGRGLELSVGYRASIAPR